ncbi:MAG: hypothetical protein KDD51_13150 [Bdellovibrionales bacterium]|nr:hypothetical protein [Bdellovibrionales bacterium]
MRLPVIIVTFLFASNLCGGASENYEKCWVNGKPLPENVNASSEIDAFQGRFSHKPKTGHLKCTRYGLPLIDMKFVDGRGTGREWAYRLDGDQTDKNRGTWRVWEYRNAKKDGKYESFRNGEKVEESLYKDDEEVWSKEFEDSKLRVVTSRKNKRSYSAAFDDHGNFTRLDCRGDFSFVPKVHRACGYPSKTTVDIYRRGKVYETLTFYKGEKQLEQAEDGTTRHFSADKLEGESIVVDPRTKEKTTTQYKAGKKHGLERVEDVDNKLLSATKYNNDLVQERIEYFLNGKKKRIETYSSPEHKMLIVYHDNGQVREKGEMVRCKSRFSGWSYSEWCPNGTHTSYYENGTKQRVFRFERGSLTGTQEIFDDKGALVEKSEYASGYLSTRTKFENGEVVEFEGFEKDGSRHTHTKKGNP